MVRKITKRDDAYNKSLSSMKYFVVSPKYSLFDTY